MEFSYDIHIDTALEINVCLVLTRHHVATRQSYSNRKIDFDF